MSNKYEIMEPETIFEPKVYNIRFVCERCANQFWRKFKAMPKKDPACPDKACAEKFELRQLKREMENLKTMIATSTPPGHIGDKPIVKAIDYTANNVMREQNMTDLRDGIREGESMAPKLPPPMQKVADNFFGGAAVAARPGMGKRMADTLGKRAMAGAFRGMAVSPQAIMPGRSSGEPVLRSVRKEEIRGR